MKDLSFKIYIDHPNAPKDASTGLRKMVPTGIPISIRMELMDGESSIWSVELWKDTVKCNGASINKFPYKLVLFIVLPL